MGVDAVLLVTPYYNKCTQAGLIAHYTAAADTVPCPVIVYNVPSRTGVDVSVRRAVRSARIRTSAWIKEASGSVPKAMRILDACAEELPLWAERRRSDCTADGGRREGRDLRFVKCPA